MSYWLVDENKRYVSPNGGKTPLIQEAKRFATEAEAGIAASCLHAQDGLRYGMLREFRVKYNVYRVKAGRVAERKEFSEAVAAPDRASAREKVESRHVGIGDDSFEYEVIDVKEEE